jgi:hypothetical protein
MSSHPDGDESRKLMEEMWLRFVRNLLGRFDGPLHFRFVVQPLMAAIFGIYSGIKDAKAGRPAYLWVVILHTDHRKELLREAWKHVGRIFVFAITIDLGYQIYVHRAFYPGEALVVAFVLAIVPYFIVRGPANRIARLFRKHTPVLHPAAHKKTGAG